jgi:hypothetical protein
VRQGSFYISTGLRAQPPLEEGQLSMLRIRTVRRDAVGVCLGSWPFGYVVDSLMTHKNRKERRRLRKGSTPNELQQQQAVVVKEGCLITNVIA